MFVTHFLFPVLGGLLLMLSAHRIFNEQVTCAKKRRALFVTAAIFPILMTWLGLPSFVLWVLIGTLFLILRGSHHFFYRFPSDLSLENALQLLDQVILSMKSGRSFRTAIKESMRAFSRQKMSRVLQEIIERMEHGGRLGTAQPIAREILDEFLAIEASGARMIASLENLRSSFRMKFIFRRRSGQVSLQSRLQAAISSLLYMPLLFFHVRSGHLFELRTLISIMLFVFAQAWIHMLARRFRWTV